MRTRQQRARLTGVLGLGSLLVFAGCPQAGPATDDAGPGAVGFELEPITTATDVGRYWARVQAHGRVDTASLAVWFEHKPQAAAWWAAEKTPEQPVGANLERSTVEEWLIGLSPGTAYQVRVCFRDEGGTAACGAPQPVLSGAATSLPWVGLDPNNPKGLVLATGAKFVPWGNNYVDPTAGPVNEKIEDAMYSSAGLARIDADLRRLVNPAPPDGANNVIRMHLQLHTFLRDAVTPDRRALAHYAKVVELVEDHGLYVMATGLNYFFPKDNPEWVSLQTEAEHWNTQAIWWNAMAAALRHSPGVFAYDLANEPYVTGSGGVVDGHARWTIVPEDAYCSYGEKLDAGVHGYCFGQYVSLGLAGRTSSEVAAAWTQKMKDAIRTTNYLENDARHLVTIGVGGAFALNNVFNSEPAVQRQLEFLSPHIYPSFSDNGLASLNLLAALATAGKPVIPGETFSLGPVRHVISQSCLDGASQGWFGQYDGRVRGDACQPGREPLTCAFFDDWYLVQSEFGPSIRDGGCPALVP